MERVETNRLRSGANDLGHLPLEKRDGRIEPDQLVGIGRDQVVPHHERHAMPGAGAGERIYRRQYRGGGVDGIRVTNYTIILVGWRRTNLSAASS